MADLLIVLTGVRVGSRFPLKAKASAHASLCCKYKGLVGAEDMCNKLLELGCGSRGLRLLEGLDTNLWGWSMLELKAEWV